LARGALAILTLGLLGVAAAAAAQPSAPDAPPGATELMRRADSRLRGVSTTGAVRLTVEGATAAGRRVVDFHSWDDRRRDRSFVRVLSPTRDAGSGFLRLPPNVWRYVPRLRRISRVRPDAMLHRWMGSDFTLDDWLHQSNDVDDYEHTLVRTDDDADGREATRAYVVESRRREGAPVAWGAIRSWIDAEVFLPLRREYFDTAGARVRTLRFQDVREVDGRPFPHRWVVTPEAEPGRETRAEFESLRFDVPLDDALFSTRHLKSPDVP